jgi:signal transduction histidine kinase
MVVRALVKNAREAAGADAAIQLHVHRTSSGGAEVRVVDPGPGFPAGSPEPGREPFGSTKGEAGLGLGLFLARVFAERLGGRLEIRSEPGHTEVVLHFPPAVVA